MKKTVLFLSSCAVLGLALSSTAMAQKSMGPKAKIMAKYDLNANGVIDGDEIAAVRKDFAAEPTGALKTYDKNNNGKLEDSEIADIKPPGNNSEKGKGGDKAKSEKKAKATSATSTSDAPAAR